MRRGKNESTRTSKDARVDNEKNGKQITTPMSHEKRDTRLYLCQKHHSQGVIKTQYLLLMRCLYALIAIVFDCNIIYYTDNIYICAINE